jgi:ribosomal RNA-processing protein 12
MEEQDDLTVTEVGIAEQHAIARYTLQVATDNLRVLRSSARNLLTVLSGILLESPKDDGGLLQVLLLSQPVNKRCHFIFH